MAVCTLGRLAATLLVTGLLCPAARAQDPSEIIAPQFAIPTPQEAAASEAGALAAARERFERLQSPQEQAALLEYQRGFLREQNPELAAALGVDAGVASQLIELLAQRSLADSLRGVKQSLVFAENPQSYLGETNADRAAQYDQERGAIKALLGQSAFRRYLVYVDTYLERKQVVTFDADLSEHLKRAQKDELIVLLAEQRRELHDLRQGNSTGTLTPESFDTLRDGTAEEFYRFNLLNNVRLNETVLERQTQLSKRLLQATAKFLSSSQQAALEARQRKSLEFQRQNLRAIRRQAELDSEQPLDAIYPRTGKEPQPITRRMQWALRLGINQREQQLSFASRSGERVRFATAEGLSMDAVAIAYDNGRMVVKLTVFEQDEAGRYRLGSLDGSGPLKAGANVPTDPDQIFSTSSTVLAGSKGYSLTISPYGVLQ